MRVFYGFESLPHFVHPVVAIGSFDGVHRGHQALISCMRAEAQARGGESIVMTFEPHPRITLGRAEGLKLLTSLDEKRRFLEFYGIDNLIVIPFDHLFSSLSGTDFVETYLVGKIGAEVLVAGYNHRFGHDRIDGDQVAAKYGMTVVKVGPCDVDGHRVSSTVIRRLLLEGKVQEAELLAGHALKKD